MLFFKSNKQKNLRPNATISKSDATQNAAVTLMANIGFSSVDTPVKSIVIPSAAPNEGKSTIAYGLAIAMGKAGRKVLIIEGDLRRRCLQSLLGIRTKHGLHAVLTGKCTVEEAIVPTDDQNLFFLNAEGGIPNPEAIIGSQSFIKLIEGLKENYDYVLIDTPPVAAFSDSSVMSANVDGTILVIRENTTERAAASYAVEQLRAAGANILGAAVNGKPAGSSSYGYYYSYYYDEEKVPASSLESEDSEKKETA